ncbi:hypothetical protein GH714_022439 [Hevea brasiliensis]|uniref:glutathione transferase n=1 Tax=Hevea brasiliensis TaxID=3981 RepID=A0A6A6LL69_HEVBR|nr:hypothetical protein GH714_022439 [Hevea brasiliensis]
MAESEELFLLDFKPSPFSARVKIALAEKGLRYESREEDLANKSPLLLETNPVYKLIPVLIHNGRPICESMIIVQYIDQVWNHKSPLLPSDPYRRADALFWADYVDKKIYFIGSTLCTSKGEAKEASRKDLIECFKILEGEIGDKPYFGGESFGYVDLIFIPFYSFFYAFETLGNFSMIEECPKIVDWAQRCLQKESVSKTLYDQLQFYDIADEQLTLLDWYPSPFTTRVRIALAEKGLNYESRQEDLSNKSPLLLEMNPVNKQIPVLIHNGRPICESMVIVQYIDEVWNHKSPLLPSDPYQRAHARFWADYIDKKVFPIGRLMWASKGEVKAASKKDLIECFKILEGELGDKPYFGGESFGYVDLSLIPFYSFFYTFETLGNLSMVEECPKIVDWAHRCLQKESVSKTLCDQRKFYEVLLELSRGGPEPKWSSVGSIDLTPLNS